MYICVCKAVTDTQIKDAISNGIDTKRKLIKQLKICTICGKCNKEVKHLLKHRSNFNKNISNLNDKSK